MPNNEIREELARLLAASGGSGGEAPRIGSSLPLAGPDRGPRGDGGNLADQLSVLTRRVQGLDARSASTDESSEGLPGRSFLESVKDRASAARNPLNLGSIVSPVVTGLIKLFRRKQETPPETLPLFRLPEAVSVDAGFSRTGGGLTGLALGADGLPRPVPAPAAPAPQVTINVQAMDTRSFLDHSGDIARAVREAMLNTHSINDVVNDL